MWGFSVLKSKRTCNECDVVVKAEIIGNLCLWLHDSIQLWLACQIVCDDVSRAKFEEVADFP